MYTQCANCETVFKLSAEVLRAAGGQVRCGRCGQVFSALARLSEDAGTFTTGESPLGLEQRADSILESVVAEQLAQSQLDIDSGEDEQFPGVDIAHLQVLDFSDEDLAEAAAGLHGDSMEFTLPPGELDRIFVEAKNGLPPIALETLPVETAANETEEPPPGIEVLEDHRPGAVPRPSIEDAAVLELASPPASSGGSFALWLSAAIVAALSLAGQVVHHHRQWLAAHGPFGPALATLYSSIGAPLAAPADLSVYHLRQWGVTGDPAADGTLRVRASILNTTGQLVPFPLLRVTLANRYGTRIGSRDFEPGEYLGKPTARLLAPGEQADATLKILDPGKDAEGFEIDVCLRGADQKIICANDIAAPQNKS